MHISVSAGVAAPAVVVSRASSRILFLDGLRGIAATVVLITHILERLSPGFQYVRGTYFDLGSFGVAVFFLCSGFVIPLSLERSPSVGHFWVRRFCRLYPLYWLSVLLVALAFVLRPDAAHTGFQQAPLQNTLAHLTMVQLLLGVPNFLPVYWTLLFEMVFYLIVTLLFALRVHRASAALTVGLILSTLLIEVLMPLAFGRHFPPAIIGFLLMMFSGTLFFRMHTGEMARRTAVPLIVIGLLVQVAAAFAGPAALGQPLQYLYMATAWAGAYLLFGSAFMLRDRPMPQMLNGLGAISYSIYLMHPVVLLLVPPLQAGLLTAVLWFSVVLGVASLTYRWIEQPAIRLGSRLTARRRAASA